MSQAKMAQLQNTCRASNIYRLKNVLVKYYFLLQSAEGILTLQVFTSPLSTYFQGTFLLFLPFTTRQQPYTCTLKRLSFQLSDRRFNPSNPSITIIAARRQLIIHELYTCVCSECPCGPRVLVPAQPSSLCLGGG